MKAFSKIIIVFVSVILGGRIGFIIFTHSEKTIWQQLDYFPLPIKNILVVEPFGEKIWVKATNNESYKIIYPCTKGETCWEKSNEVPPSPPNGEYIDENIHEYMFYDKSLKGCMDNYNISVFPGELQICITFAALNESTYVFAVVMDKNNEIWVWDSPWESPYDMMERMFSLIFICALIGFFIGILLIQVPIKNRNS